MELALSVCVSRRHDTLLLASPTQPSLPVPACGLPRPITRAAAPGRDDLLPTLAPAS